MILSDLAAMLAAPPGNLAYQFSLILSLGLLYAFSQVQHRHTSLTRAARWTLAGGWLFALRLIALAAVLLEWQLLLGSAEVLPALETFIDLSGLLLFAWAFLVPQSDLRSDQFLMIAVVLNVVALAAALVGERLGLPRLGLDTRAIYVGWDGAALLFTAAGMTLFLLRRPPQWRLALLGFVALAVGYETEVLAALSAPTLGGGIRLASLIAYPILAVGAVRSMVLTEAEELAAQSQDKDLEKLAYTREAEANIALALSGLASAENPDHLAARAARAVAETMRTEYCLLLTPPDPDGEFSIATGYDLIREQILPGAGLDRTRSPLLADGFDQDQVIRISSHSDATDVYTLQRLLGLETIGPAMFVPISEDHEVHGGLLLLSPFARRNWTEAQQSLVEGIARHLAERFRQFKSRAPASGEAYEALLEAQERIHRLERDNMRLFEALHAEGELDLEALESVGRFSSDAQEAGETIAILEAEIERLKSTGRAPAPLPTSEELEQLKDELQEALRARAEATARADDLETALAEVEGGTRMRGVDVEAIASIASELRQPMSTVLGYTDLLLGESVGLLGAMQRKFLDRVRGAIERMSHLLNDLVQITALETGSLNLTMAPVDLLGCVEDAVRDVGSGLREKDIGLQMDFPDQVPAVLGDEEAISQIVVHLLKNAISVTPENETIVLSAIVETSAREGFLMLSVRDAGEGIPPEDLGRVFQRLYQADRMMIPGLGDAGVGLSLVKALSEALGGRIWVESDPGSGSTFTVLLPLASSAGYLEAEPTA